MMMVKPSGARSIHDFSVLMLMSREDVHSTVSNPEIPCETSPSSLAHITSLHVGKALRIRPGIE